MHDMAHHKRPEDDSTRRAGPCCNAQTTAQRVSGTAVNVHTTRTSLHKMWIFTSLKSHFIIKMWGESRFTLTDGYLWLWRFDPWSQKGIRLSKLSSYFSSKTPSFPQFSVAVARCYNGWNLNKQLLKSNLALLWLTCPSLLLVWDNMTSISV